MFKLIGKDMNAILGTQTILLWTYVRLAITISFITSCLLMTARSLIKANAIKSIEDFSEEIES